MAILKFINGVSKSIIHYNANTEVTTNPSFTELDLDNAVAAFATLGLGNSFELTEGSGITITISSPDVVDDNMYDMLIATEENNPKYAPDQVIVDYVYTLI